MIIFMTFNEILRIVKKKNNNLYSIMIRRTEIVIYTMNARSKYT